MLTNDNWVIGQPIDTAELAACLELWRQSFLTEPPEHYETPAQAGFVNPQVLVRDGEIAAVLDVLAMGQWFGGKSVPMGGLRGVAVAPEHRGAGLASHLVKKVLTDLKEAGFPLSALYASTQRLYRKLGYEVAGTRFWYRQNLTGVDVRERGLTLRRAGESDRVLLAEVYRQRAMRASGNLNRTPWVWDQLLKPKGQTAEAYLVMNEGVAEGYVVLQRRRGTPGPKPYDLAVMDVAALTPRAARRLWAFLADHRSMAGQVQWFGGPADPWLTPLDEQAPEVMFRQPWMLRLVDVEAALAARGYPEGLYAELHLAVTDEVLPWNAGSYVLEVADGAGRVRRGGDGRLRLDVRALATLYSGYANALELALVGGVDGSPGDLAAAAAVFSGPAPWMPDMF